MTAVQISLDYMPQQVDSPSVDFTIRITSYSKPNDTKVYIITVRVTSYEILYTQATHLVTRMGLCIDGNIDSIRIDSKIPEINTQYKQELRERFLQLNRMLHTMTLWDVLDATNGSHTSGKSHASSIHTDRGEAHIHARTHARTHDTLDGADSGTRDGVYSSTHLVSESRETHHSDSESRGSAQQAMLEDIARRTAECARDFTAHPDFTAIHTTKGLSKIYQYIKNSVDATMPRDTDSVRLVAMRVTELL